ncbi:MerR family transcriptional regulator [Microlunatus elymi]|uniref:MerR family transcriptional regulator n=1 Tax=Microlunatus elymi TaxID=2596828 RepID=A0A516Q310_9ACTN|nr:MerR family transcriptional regulator [Microlunatus elymi]QDP97806.1 MerR family transcriptional regulator [Microlunatus elymi]
MTSERLMSIGAVAEQTGLSIRTLRHYDDVGLVPPSARSDGGFRLYTPTDVDRLITIRRMKPLGFTLDEMRQVLASLACLDDPAASTGDRDHASEVIADYHQRAEDSCRKLRRQLDYAEELTRLLARHARGS